MNTTSYHTRIEKSLAFAQWNDETVRGIYQQVFRTDFSAPGFALISFQEAISSQQLRFMMWTLKVMLSALHEETNQKRLVYLSLGRFDSQNTTKFHLDGAPEEAFLMLGYEASPVHSELATADYARAAHDWKITPQQLLADFNPMFAVNEEKLLPYVTRLSGFDISQSHILLLNNCSLPYAPESANLLGVMHQATITPNPQAQRIVNSTMMTTANVEFEEPTNRSAQQQFLETDQITGSL